MNNTRNPLAANPLNWSQMGHDDLRSRDLLRDGATLALEAADLQRYRVRHVGDALGPPAINRPKAPKIETLPTRWRRHARVLGELPKRVSKRAAAPLGVGSVNRRPQVTDA
jgi:hypothetical protein